MYSQLDACGEIIVNGGKLDYKKTVKKNSIILMDNAIYNSGQKCILLNSKQSTCLLINSYF